MLTPDQLKSDAYRAADDFDRAADMLGIVTLSTGDKRTGEAIADLRGEASWLRMTPLYVQYREGGMTADQYPSYLRTSRASRASVIRRAGKSPTHENAARLVDPTP